MFKSLRLPTLDSEIWYCRDTNKVMFSFYEKTTSPNRVLQKQTTLSETYIRASLTQEVVRRLRNCSLDLPRQEKQQIISVFCQKMINSGHSVASTQNVVVHGVLKFIDLCNRRLRKILAKTCWYDDHLLDKKTSWRISLPQNWARDRPAQFKVPGMQFSSVMMVPSSNSGRLFKMLTKAEPRLAKSSGYQIKLIEKPGRPLTRFFNKSFSSNRCHRTVCAVCSGSELKGPSKFGLKSVVYKGVCQICEENI